MKLIYFDNAATTHFKPNIVKKALLKAVKISANPGRSGHKLSIQNSKLVWSARQALSKYFNCEEEGVVFTKNCTEALNLAILGIVKNNKGSVITSTFEHNSVLRPLKELERENKINLLIATPQNSSFITRFDIEKLLTPNTFLVCLTAVSNVTGNRNDIEGVGKLCREKNILFLVDFAQGIGHIKLDMKKQNINYLAFSGHKGLLTYQGIGALLFTNAPPPSPIMFGGTGTESINFYQPKNPPESLESGTLSTPLISQIPPAIKYLEKNFAKHNKKVEMLTNFLLTNLKKLKNITIYSNSSLSGVVSFNIKGYDSTEISDYLDKFNIATRSGLHCAPLTHKFYNTTECGMVRVSLNFKNTFYQIKFLIKKLRLLKEKQPL